MTTTTRAALLAAFGGVLAAGAAIANWSDDPAVNYPVASGPGSQALPKLKLRSDNSAFVSWFDNRSGNFDVYIQLLDDRGGKTYPSPGLVVSDLVQPTSLVDYDMVLDSAGNAYVIFTESVNGGDRDVRVTKIFAGGVVGWTTSLSMNSDLEADPRAVVLDTVPPSIAVTWPRYGATQPGLQYQRLDTATGATLLPGQGIVIAGGPSDGGAVPAFHEMLALPGGDFIVVYVRDTRTFMSPRHIWAQRFDASGTGLWNGGLPTIVSSFSVPIAHRPRIVSDGAQGVVIAWHDSSAGPSTVWANRLGDTGASMFGGNVSVSTNNARLRFDPDVLFDVDTQSTVVFFNERDGSQNQRGVYGQRLDMDGARLWGAEGAEFTPVSLDASGTPRAGRMGDDFVVVFSLTGFGSADSALQAMRIDLDAQRVWGMDPIDLAAPAMGGKSRVQVAVDGANQAVVVWEDTRAGDLDIYGQNINPDGSLGVLAFIADLDGDGQVGSSDLSIMLGSWGPCPPAPADCIADLDNDGMVGSSDLAILLGSWG